MLRWFISHICINQHKSIQTKRGKRQYRIKVNFLYLRMFLPPVSGPCYERAVYRNLKNQISLSLRCSIYHSPAGGFIPKVLGFAAVEASCPPLLPRPTSGLQRCIRSNHLPKSKIHFFTEVIVYKRAVGCQNAFAVMILSGTQLMYSLPFSFLHHQFSQ